MPASRKVDVESAAPDEAPLLENLQLYVHDTSENFAVELGADARFRYERLPVYWSEPERRFPFLIRADGELAGFALVTRGSSGLDAPDLLDVAELFVLRSHRRRGVDREAAFALWKRLPGSWLVRVSAANRAGVPFWRATVGEFTCGAFSESARPGRPHPWRVFAFESASRARSVARAGGAAGARAKVKATRGAAAKPRTRRARRQR